MSLSSSKPAFLLTLILGGLLVAPASPQELSCPRPSFSTLSAAATGLIFISYAYSGWNAAAYIMSEVPRATEIVPRAIPAGTLTVMVLYSAFNYVLFRHLSIDELSGKVEVGRLLAQKLWGDKGDLWLGWGISLAMVSSVSAMLMISPRVLSVMGEDYPPLRVFSRRNAFGAPVRALLLIVSLALAVLLQRPLMRFSTASAFCCRFLRGWTVLGLSTARS